MKFLFSGYSFVFFMWFAAGILQSAKSQPNDIDVLVNKIKTEYPVYKDKIKNSDFDIFVESIKKEKHRDTFWMLSKITNLFNDMHLQIADTGYLKRADTSGCKRKLIFVTQYLNNAAIVKENTEGYWINNNNDCVIGIKRLSTQPLIYQCFLIESKYTKLPPGFIIATLEETSNNFETEYIDLNSGIRFCLKSVFQNSGTLAIGPYSRWKKISNYTSPVLQNLIKRNNKASAKIIDSSTFLIQIPACSRPNIFIVDSLVKANKSVIEKSENLIVDIRNNMGGFIDVYEPLLPFIYTNPIMRAGGYTYCVDDVIEDEKNSITEMEKKGRDSSVIAAEKQWLDTLIKNKGKFVWNAGDTLQYDSVTQFPKNVALLTGYNNMSAAELMIFNFKQSKKVTTFGERTYGAVDNSDFYPVQLASARYVLYIPSSATIIPYHEKEHFDGIGIPPDVPIGIDTADWIEFVKNYYEKNH